MSDDGRRTRVPAGWSGHLREGLITKSEELRRTVPALVAGFAIAIVFGAVLSIVLTAAGPDGMGLSSRQTSGWIALIYGLPMLPSLVLTLRYRVPMLLTGNVFALIFFASLGGRVGFPELAGAAMLAGGIVLVTALLGFTGRIARWIPVPIVYGLIAGAVLPFVVDIFSALSTSDGRIPVAVPIMVGSAVLAYLIGQRVLGPRLPAILPAFLVGLLVAALTGQLGGLPSLFTLPGLEFVRPEFSWTAIVTVTPVLLALMTVQSNVPSVIYLRSQGYDPPERLLNVISGAGTLLGSLFGPVTVSLALPPLLLAAGPAAGDRSVRYRSIYVPVAAGLLIALFAGAAAALAVPVPTVLLLTIAGLALVPALTVALREITAGPLMLGPLLTFAIALSDMSLLGLGPFFWSLVVGTLVSMLFEREGWRELRGAMSTEA
jgi:benzoate membrane transport protein